MSRPGTGSRTCPRPLARTLDGPSDDGSPLWAAISAWYPAAVDSLVRCGARVDNLLFAAAAGDLHAVQSYFDAAGKLVPERAFDVGRSRALARPGRSRLVPEHMLEYGLHWAAARRRRHVVAFLLTRHPDLGVIEPTWNNTALDGARYGGDPAIIALIEPLFGADGRPR